MTTDDRKRAVAVFGSNHPGDGELEAADYFGRAVVARGAVVLTGGRLGHGLSSVKGRAIQAAVDAGATGDDLLWIGVANEPAPERPVLDRRGMVLTPGGSHQRNFVEACLCDAAIAIGVTKGTSSEALFSLYLRRPVALVGWSEVGDLPATTTRLLAAAKRAIKSPSDPANAVERGIADAYLWATSSPHGQVSHVPLPRDEVQAGEIVGALLAVADTTPHRPRLQDLVDDASWQSVVARCAAARTAT